jgi:hypothetical protein
MKIGAFLYLPAALILLGTTAILDNPVIAQASPPTQRPALGAMQRPPGGGVREKLVPETGEGATLKVCVNRKNVWEVGFRTQGEEGT